MNYTSNKAFAVITACNILSGVSCIVAATIIFIFKRDSKVLYRFEIGLAGAFGITHLANFVLVFSFFHSQDYHRVLFYIACCLRVISLGASMNYLIAMYSNYLLKSKGWSEERMRGIETKVHLLVWILSLFYILFIFFHHRASFIVVLSLVGCKGLYIIVSSLYVYSRQRIAFSKHSEVLSPLVTARTKQNLNFFFRRLLVLSFISFLVFVQALLYLPKIHHFVNEETKSNYLTEIFPLDGFVISILLITAPSLIAAYKNKYLQCTSSYDPIPRSPMIVIDNFSPSADPRKAQINSIAFARLSQ